VAISSSRQNAERGRLDGVRLQRAMRRRDFKMTARHVHPSVDDLRASAASRSQTLAMMARGS
jgi:hypothetical protein